MTATDYIKLFFAAIGMITTVSLIGGYLLYRFGGDFDIEINIIEKRA